MKKVSKKKSVTKTTNIFGENRSYYGREIKQADSGKLFALLNIKTHDVGYNEFADKSTALLTDHDIVFKQVEDIDRMINELERLKRKFIETNDAVNIVRKNEQLLKDLKISVTGV